MTFTQTLAFAALPYKGSTQDEQIKSSYPHNREHLRLSVILPIPHIRIEKA